MPRKAFSPPLQQDNDEQAKTKVCLIGSGNWASAIATIVGENCLSLPFCQDQVNMWTHEEQVKLCANDGHNDNDNKDGSTNKSETTALTRIINERHENVKYLPGIQLPDNVVAVSDLAEACQGANLLIFVLPHQFLPELLPEIRKHVDPQHCRGVSLVKGLDFDRENHKPILISHDIAKTMGQDFRCGVLMGANVATEVARKKLCESTLACDFNTSPDTRNMNEETRQIFDAPTFCVQHCKDVAGAGVSGALKNILALGAGFVDGLDCGENTKAALLRTGLLEIMTFAEHFFPSVKRSTFWQSCGIADVITTCYGGRHRKCAQVYARQRRKAARSQQSDAAVDCCKQWDDIEADLLNGQKLQGTLTTKDMYQVLRVGKMTEDFPVFTAVYEIAFEGRPVEDISNAIGTSSRKRK